MINGIISKFHDKSGETLAEVLVALLISSIGLTLLAGMIGSASKIIQTSHASMESYYKASSELSAKSVGTAATGDVSFESAEGDDMWLTPTHTDINVKYYIHSENNNIVMYRR